nr:MAG TPA: PcfK-like protein [Caudoviricetes sp.]
MTLTEGQKRAIEKLDKEMEAAKDPCSKYIAEQLLQQATSCPEVAEKILAEKKSLAGALDAIKAEAKKHAVGGCGCVDEAQAVKIACKYYNIKATKPAAEPAAVRQALGKNPETSMNNGVGTAAVSVNLDDFF